MALKLTQNGTGKTWSSSSKKKDDEEQKTTGATSAPVVEKNTSKSGKLTLTRTSTSTPTQTQDEPNVFERIGNVLTGAGRSTASDFTNLGGTITEGLGRIGSGLQDKRAARLAAQDQAYLEQARRDLAAAQASGDAQAAKNAQIRINQAEYRLKHSGVLDDLYDEINREATQKIYSKADELGASAQQDITEAKEGLGGVGQFLVDAGVAGTQLAGDMGLAMLTGGSTVVPMAARVFGGSAGEARQSGADFGQQVAYGAGSALVSGLTEKLGNVGGVFQKAFGSGVLDKALAKVAAKPAGKLVAGMLSEGGEEFVEALAQPLLQKLTYDPDAAYDEDWLSEALYSAAIGAVLGGAGTALSPSTYISQPAVEQNAMNPATELGAGVREEISEGKFTPEVKNAAEGLKMAFAEAETAEQVSPAQADMRTMTLDEAKKTLGKQGYQAFEAAFREGSDPVESFRELTRAYNEGMVNRKTGSSVVTEAQYDAMYEAGRADAAASIEVQAKQAGYTTVHGKDSGLVYDDYVKQTLDTKTAKTVNTVAKALGIKVQFADSVAGGDANAQIQNGIVTIEKGNQNPVRFLFGHEITHRMQELAPAEYARLREAVVEAGMESNWVDTAVKREQLKYAQHGKSISSEAALDEKVADYVGTLLEDSGELERFIRKHQDDRSLLEKLRDAFRELARKLRGSQYDKQIRDVEKRLSETLDAAVKQVEKNGQRAYTGATEARFSAKDAPFYETEITHHEIDDDIVSWNQRRVAAIQAYGLSNMESQGLGRYVGGDAYEWTSIQRGETKFEKTEYVEFLIEQAIAGFRKMPTYEGRTYRNLVFKNTKDLKSFAKEYAIGNDVTLKAFSSASKDPNGYVVNNGYVVHMVIDGVSARDIADSFGVPSQQEVVYQPGTVLHIDRIAKANDGNILIYAQEVNQNGKELRADLQGVGQNSSGAVNEGRRRAEGRDRRGGVLEGVSESGEGKGVAEVHAAVSNVNVNADVGVAYDAGTESVSPAKLSLKTWKESDYVQAREEAAAEMAKALDITPKKAKAYIDSVNSIAKLIAEDRVRLDYEASPGRSSFVNNVEYGGSIDFSTICKKRRLYTGTFEAIRNALPNTALTAEEILEIRSMMDKKGYEVSCGLCYVEGSRANMGQYAKQFLEEYRKTNPAYMPNMAEINTPNGLEKIRIQHPEVYAAYEAHMNSLAQRKPKLYQLQTEYQGEVLNRFRNKGVEQKNANGGLRMQSFSDFEIVHLIDCMQVIMDMSRVGLAGQAYTKVPDFAWALGDTGLKINLSLIAKGVDSKGRLILDEKEGMSEKDAMALRDRYSENVGTIIVVFTDRQLKAAMADERIDYIIPFHRSQWNKSQYEAMGLPANAKDFTSWQNESYIEPVYSKSGKKQRPDNYMPNTYWDFSKSGKENAEAYLQMCAANNRRPKFHYLLVDNKDGSYSLQPDGSTDGYWKTLIDFKMYDNRGKGSPQMPVRPDFNMDEAQRMLKEYTGGHNTFPAAQDVVDAFVKKYKREHKGAKFSLKDADYMDAVVRGDMETAQKMVDEAAEAAMPDSKIRGKNGKLLPVYHGTNGSFNVFDPKFSGGKNGTAEGYGIYTSDNPKVTSAYGNRQIKMYANIKKPAYSNKKTIKAAALVKLIKDTCMRQAMDMVAEGDYDSEQDALFDTWISNYVYTYDLGMERSYREAATEILRMNDSDMAVVQEVMSGMSIRDYYSAMAFYEESLTPITGFDGIWTQWDNAETGEKSNIILAFNSNQLKQAEAITRDDNGDVIPLGQRFNSGSDDIRYSLKDSDSLAREIARIQKEGRTKKRSKADVQADIRAVVQEAYAGMIEEYGAFAPGENPVRDVKVPKQSSDDRKVSQTVRTVMEAGATPDEMLPNIQQMVATGEFSYDVYTDEAAIADANNRIQKVGWAQALADWTDEMRKGVVSKENTATGWALYNNAANSGDVDTALTILDYMVKHQRNAAQALQATRILKKLSPETQLYQVQRSVESLQEELNKRYGRKGAPELQVDQQLAEQYLKAKDQDERDAVLKDIYRDIGRQLPSRFIDKWNAWRYLAMLGNPRTHVRNVVGNAGFALVVVAKNATATFIEWAVNRVSRGKLNRTKSIVGFSKADRALLAAAWADYAKVQDAAMSGGKYNDFANANQYIEEGRQIFRFKPLEAARKGNTKAMEEEDVWFSKPHYAFALASYCKQHGLTPEQIARGKETKVARAYAIREAQKATYRDTNALSQTISELGKTRAGETNPVKKGVGVVMEGILPFRKTPANILARGIEYSPVGLLNGIKQALFDVRTGKKTGAEAIDSISAGLTGTGLLALGVYLAAQGLVRGHGDDEEDENDFMEMMGHQAYALEVGDTSVTLDWLAPECLPFFIGVNLWEQTGKEDEEVTLSSLLNAVTTVTEPLLEMSCLQSLNDVFDAVGYAASDGLDGLPAALASAATSYLTQGLPTILGQAERSGEGDRMTTYTEKNDFLTGDMQYTLGRASARLPGWDYQQIPYIDAWGRTESNGATGERMANNFLNPAYTSEIQMSAMEKELLRLYEKTGESKIFPSRAEKSFTVNKVEKNLTANEYVKFAKKKGQTAYTVLTGLTKSSAYKAMDDADKVKAISQVYSYAGAVAKMSVSSYKPDGWIADAIATSSATGLSADKYLTIYLNSQGIDSLKNKNTGKTINTSQSLLIMEMIYNTPGLNEAQRKALFENLVSSESVRHYNRALVEQKLAEMRTQAK